MASGEIARLIPVRLNEMNGVPYGQSEGRRAVMALLRANDKLAEDLRINKKWKGVTTATIAKLCGTSKSGVSRVLKELKPDLEFGPSGDFEYLDYDLGMCLLKAHFHYLTRANSLPVESSHLRDLCHVYAQIEELLVGLLDTNTRSLRPKIAKFEKDLAKEEAADPDPGVVVSPKTQELIRQARRAVKEAARMPSQEV